MNTCMDLYDLEEKFFDGVADHLPIIVFWVIALIVLIIACVIHSLATDSFLDFEEFFVYEHGWVTLLVVLGIELIVFACIFWIWWAMLIIVFGMSAVAGIIAFFVIRARSAEYDDEDEEDDEDAQPTRFKCPNCGGAIVKIEVDYDLTHGKPTYIYKCPYCGITFEEKDVSKLDKTSGKGDVAAVKNGNDNGDLTYSDLNDFEEEYFEACERMLFRPYNLHTEKQIERKYKNLSDKIDSFEDIYDDIGYFYSADILEKAYDFLNDNEEEIQEYFDKYGEEEIKKRYDVYDRGDE